MTTPSQFTPEAARRRDEIAAGLDAVRERVARACAAAGRRPQELTLVAVTKLHPVTDLIALAELGMLHIGESREQEASAKHAELASAAGAVSELVWHFVGRLQANKCRRVARIADVVHSVDRAALLAPLGRGARESGRSVEVLIQISLDGDPARGGVPVPGGPDALLRLAEATAAVDGLALRGLMAVAPRDADPGEAFSVLPAMSGALRAEHPSAGVVSAGMSGDLEAAIAAGATHLRVGSAILGARPPLG